MIKASSKSKLTLWVPEDIKEFGKRFGRARHSSISALFTSYLKRLKGEEEHPAKVTPLVQKITGVIKSMPRHETYKKHLEKKYL